MMWRAAEYKGSMSAETIDLIANLGPFHWWALAAVLVGLEMAMPTQYMLWPGLAAVCTGLLMLIMPGIAWTGQLAFFAVLAGGLALSARYWPRAAGEEGVLTRLNARVEGYIGRQAIIAEDFSGSRGVVILDDTRWQAETVDGRALSARTVVEIIGSDGALLKVKPVG
jgi:membrane protein implicated in regulation of membrane protease activity